MPYHRDRIADLSVTKFKIAMLLEDEEIRSNYPFLVDAAFEALQNIESNIMTLRSDFQGNNVVDEDKYQQAGD